MIKASAPVLLYAPYPPPHCRKGDWIEDAILGLTEVGGWTSAPIPWPRRKKSGRSSLILTGDLVRAVGGESVESVCYWWGVGATTVWAWRKALGVDRVTDGTRILLQERTGVPPDAAARGRDKAKSDASRAKISISKKGKPAHPATRAALASAARRPKPEGWGKRANTWMLDAKRKPTDTP